MEKIINCLEKLRSILIIKPNLKWMSSFLR